MEVNAKYVDYIVALAKEVESQDPIDWGMLTVSEDDAYRLLASTVVENLAPKYNDPDFQDVMVATVVKLVVENFTLNLKLRDKQYGGKTV